MDNLKKFDRIELDLKGNEEDSRLMPKKNPRFFFLDEEEHFINLYVEHDQSGQYGQTKSIYHLAKYKVEEGKFAIKKWED